MLILGVLLVTICTAILPYILAAVSTINVSSVKSILPLTAAGCFFIAWFIPDVHISAQTTTFQQHFVGGGVYCALLYGYFSQLIGWKPRLPLDYVTLFAWTSTFGVANELLEFTLTQTSLARIGTGDTDWDLLANTLGALTGFSIYLAIRNLSHRSAAGRTISDATKQALDT